MTSEQSVEKSTQKHFTKKHELHLTTLQVAAVESMEKKYKRGVEENQGTKLWEMPTARLVEEAIAEATDQMVYGRYRHGKGLRQRKGGLSCEPVFRPS